MSTKTTFKRVAVVAAAALTFAGISGVAAHATQATPVAAIAGQIIGSVGGTANTAPTANAVGDGAHYVNLTFTAGTADNYYSVVSTGVGTLVTPVASNATSSSTQILSSSATSLNWYKGATIGSGAFAGTETLSVAAVSATTGTQTITVTGSTSAAITATISWVASSSTALSAANTTVALSSSACSAPTASNTAAQDAAQFAASATTSAASGSSTAAYLCVSARNGNGQTVNLASGSVAYNSLGATVGSLGTSNWVSAAINTTSGTTGSSTVTVILADASGNIVTKTLPLAITGAATTVSLANVSYSANYGGTAPGANTIAGLGTSGAYLSSTGAAGVIAAVFKDSNGNIVNGSSTSPTVNYSSSAFPGVASATAGSTVVFDSTDTATTVAASTVTGLGSSENLIIVNCHLSSKAEKLTVSLTATLNGVSVTSNSVNFYCANSTVASVTVTPKTASLASGASTAVDVSAVDANGYPVPDGSAITYAATNGAIAAGSSSTTNGANATDATFISTGANAIVTGIVGGVLGSASIAGSSDAADASSLATDAANAATDAANAAAESADNATQAASDALAAVQALQASVTSLFAQLKAQIAALTKLVSPKMK